MVERGKVPSLVTYNSLIDGYGLRGEMKKAKEIFDLMKIKGHVPDLVTYNSLLNGYCKKSKIDEALHLCKDALELFNEMCAHHLISPDAFTYRIVLEGLCNNHQVDEALSLFRLMGESKLDLDIGAYNILIDGSSKCRKPDIAKALFNEISLVREAESLFLQMEGRGCPPDRVTYNVLLKGLLKNGQHDTIEMLLQKMDEQGFSVEASSLSLLLDHISSRLLDDSLLKLIGKLVPKEGKELGCLFIEHLDM
ncbi:hypothetical protein OSB04_012055 [Centaurea solstitialis]|uniref:Pentatricopeptide repeat-containing protein n=1 Tax=Centaurea solstitialis TaxID=347529 RepID=A0AA38TLE0_9ASTR|nr:hypothetical protein OSB04_012055 [Centaurea solstitialis]